jgi:hypothetical protein
LARIGIERDGGTYVHCGVEDAQRVPQVAMKACFHRQHSLLKKAFPACDGVFSQQNHFEADMFLLPIGDGALKDIENDFV